MADLPDDPWAALPAAAPARASATERAGEQGSGTAGALGREIPRSPVSPALAPLGDPEVLPVLPATPEQQLRERVTQAHLSLEGAHEQALRVLDDVANGRVKDAKVQRDGSVVEVPVSVADRLAAARALLGHASQVAKQAPIHVDHANIVSVGEMITKVDPEKLRAAVARLKGEAP